MLNNNTTNEKLLRDERQGKMLLHTEFSLLSLLQNEEGVIQQHGMFSVSIMEHNLQITTHFFNTKIYYRFNGLKSFYLQKTGYSARRSIG